MSYDTRQRIRCVSRRPDCLIMFTNSLLPTAYGQAPLSNLTPPRTNCLTLAALPPGSTWVPDVPGLREDINKESG